METNIIKTEKGFTLNITRNDSSFGFSNVPKEELRNQIDKAIKEETKGAIRVWNPRSRRHDIIEQ
jgi:hypothetical protein